MKIGLQNEHFTVLCILVSMYEVELVDDQEERGEKEAAFEMCIHHRRPMASQMKNMTIEEVLKQMHQENIKHGWGLGLWDSLSSWT